MPALSSVDPRLLILVAVLGMVLIVWFFTVGGSDGD